MSDIKLRVVPLFPSQATAVQGIRLNTKNGRYVFSLDYTGFGINPLWVPQPGQSPVAFDGTSYFRIDATSLVVTIITTPSPLTIGDTAAVGAVVGTLSVVGGVGTYVFSLTSNPGGLYSIVGNQLQVAVGLTAGIDPIIIQAFNGIGHPHTLATTVTVTHVHVGYAPTYHIYGF
jgi:hypothetical protein